MTADAATSTETNNQGVEPPFDGTPEDKITFALDTERKVEGAMEVSPDNTIGYSDTTVEEPVSGNEQTSPILSMAKLEDLENFMDTLLDSELDDSTLASQNAAHITKLSVSQPLSDTQLMGELHKLNEKLLPSTSNCVITDGGKVKEKSVSTSKHFLHQEGNNRY